MGNISATHKNPKLDRTIVLLPLLLCHAGVNANAREVAVNQQSVKLVGARNGLDKDDDLVELQIVQKIVQLSVFLRFLQLNVVLLKTMQCELGFIINIDLQRLFCVEILMFMFWT